MSMRKTLLNIALLAGSSIIAAPVFSQGQDDPLVDRPDPPVVSLDGYPEIQTKLSPHELAILEDKRDAIIQYLYERQELQGLRDVLRRAESEDAFASQMREQVPLSADEIRMVRRSLREVEQARNSPLSEPPKLQMRTVDLNVDDQNPIKVYVARGYSSSIVFFDQTGSPWPLQTGVDALGDASAFSAQTVSEDGHVATFQILKEFSQSNALVVLDNLPVPVVLQLIGSDDRVDSRLSVRVPRSGPNAKLQAEYRSEVDNAPPDMMAFLNGESLQGSKPYAIKGVTGEVLKKGPQLYLRTRANLISPPPMQSLVSASGYNVYTLPLITHLLFSIDGSMHEATIERMYTPELAPSEDIFSDAGEY